MQKTASRGARTHRRISVMPFRSGRHFLQIPSPTNVPDHILRAIDRPTIDHRSRDFGSLGREATGGLKHLSRTEGDVIIFPACGTGAWEDRKSTRLKSSH